MQAMESAFDVCTEDLFNQTVKLEEMEKKAGNAEGEVSGLRGRLILLQENNESRKTGFANLHWSWLVLVKGLIKVSDRELSWKTDCPTMKSQLTILTNSLVK